MCVYSLINMDADKSIYKSINQSRGKHNKKRTHHAGLCLIFNITSSLPCESAEPTNGREVRSDVWSCGGKNLRGRWRKKELIQKGVEPLVVKDICREYCSILALFLLCFLKKSASSCGSVGCCCWTHSEAAAAVLRAGDRQTGRRGERERRSAASLPLSTPAVWPTAGWTHVKTARKHNLYPTCL